MYLKLDVKTLIIGILLGAVLVSVIGADIESADVARFGIALQQGPALVKTLDGGLYVVNADTGMATPVLQARSTNASPGDSRDYRSAIFNLNTITRPVVPAR